MSNTRYIVNKKEQINPDIDLSLNIKDLNLEDDKFSIVNNGHKLRFDTDNMSSDKIIRIDTDSNFDTLTHLLEKNNNIYIKNVKDTKLDTSYKPLAVNSDNKIGYYEPEILTLKSGEDTSVLTLNKLKELNDNDIYKITLDIGDIITDVSELNTKTVVFDNNIDGLKDKDITHDTKLQYLELDSGETKAYIIKNNTDISNINNTDIIQTNKISNLEVNTIMVNTLKKNIYSPSNSAFNPVITDTIDVGINNVYNTNSTKSISVGYDNTFNGTTNKIIGTNNQSTSNSTIIGDNNAITGANNILIGANNITSSLANNTIIGNSSSRVLQFPGIYTNMVNSNVYTNKCLGLTSDGTVTSIDPNIDNVTAIYNSNNIYTLLSNTALSLPIKYHSMFNIYFNSSGTLKIKSGTPKLIRFNYKKSELPPGVVNPRFNAYFSNDSPTTVIIASCRMPVEVVVSNVVYIVCTIDLFSLVSSSEIKLSTITVQMYDIGNVVQVTDAPITV